MQPRVTCHDEPPAEAAALVDAGLGEANDAAAPLHEVRPLMSTLTLPSGEVIGGALGRTWGRCCELQQLWVAPAHRRQGHATRLVQAFHAHAEARGCTRYYLDTYSFQAPSLYRSLGYTTVLTLEGYGPGIVKHTMLRELPAPDRPLPPPDPPP